MKQYEKPKLTAISLSGNEQLCGSCADVGKKPILGSGLEDILITAVDKNLNGRLDSDEKEHSFGNSEETCTVQVESYCKYTSADNNSGLTMVAWS